MIGRLVVKLRSPMEERIERFSERFPIFSGVLFQVIAATFMLAVVGGIGLIGGSIIWMFYSIFG